MLWQLQIIYEKNANRSFLQRLTWKVWHIPGCIIEFHCHYSGIIGLFTCVSGVFEQPPPFCSFTAAPWWKCSATLLLFHSWEPVWWESHQGGKTTDVALGVRAWVQFDLGFLECESDNLWMWTLLQGLYLLATNEIRYSSLLLYKNIQYNKIWFKWEFEKFSFLNSKNYRKV